MAFYYYCYLCRHNTHDGETLGNLVSPKKHAPRNKLIQSSPVESSPLASMRERTDKALLPEPSPDSKKITEKIRPKTGLIVRGLMSRPTPSGSQVRVLLLLCVCV